MKNALKKIILIIFFIFNLNLFNSDILDEIETLISSIIAAPNFIPGIINNLNIPIDVKQHFINLLKNGTSENTENINIAETDEDFERLKKIYLERGIIGLIDFLKVYFELFFINYYNLNREFFLQMINENSIKTKTG